MVKIIAKSCMSCLACGESLSNFEYSLSPIIMSFCSIDCQNDYKEDDSMDNEDDTVNKEDDSGNKEDDNAETKDADTNIGVIVKGGCFKKNGIKKPSMTVKFSVDTMSGKNAKNNLNHSIHHISNDYLDPEYIPINMTHPQVYNDSFQKSSASDILAKTKTFLSLFRTS